jgi:hypothetical protein
VTYTGYRVFAGILSRISARLTLTQKPLGPKPILPRNFFDQRTRFPSHVVHVLRLAHHVTSSYKDNADVRVIKHTSRYPFTLRFPGRVKILLHPESTVFNSLSTLRSWDSVAIIKIIATVSPSHQLKVHPGFSIVTTGHSLGGSLSSLAAVALKHNFPNTCVPWLNYHALG